MANLLIREALFRFERTLGLIHETALSVERSEAAVQRSRARLAMTDPHTLRRLFTARMDRQQRSIGSGKDAPPAGLRLAGDARLDGAAASPRF